ncbi:polysaccharide biosynthesis protein [Vitreimonas flagellata]|uniref:polysaccharide biosynthesis protein n=1 Tax=Vitreimonas flagellata TaxID=2560861 RepID=UPI00142F63E5|nr:polysaccharide biosynthesis protein [Vitreimonas flagellata]
MGSASAVRDAWSARDIWRARGMTLHGAVVIGPGEVEPQLIARLPAWDALNTDALGCQTLVLAEPPRSAALSRDLLHKAANARMRIELIEGGLLRPLALRDLIGGSLADIDAARIANTFAGKRVLITGGGGSIGSELARRLAVCNPAQLTLLDSSEYNLFRIGNELRDARIVMADVRDAASVRRWFTRERPQIVFHAAALKQVPLVEAFPSEGVLTNVNGLRNVAEAAQLVDAELVFLSTDKAVDPSGVMGASKRLGEMYCQSLDRRGPRRAIPVRLGNVLGSAGSVAPIFEKQLAMGGPLTVTDPQVTRYFISIPQAADALLHAAAASFADERRGAVLTIDMGEALSIVELARETIRLSGQRPDEDVSIVFTGLRPGEKLHESLIASDEAEEAGPADGLIAAQSPPRGLGELHELMERLTLLAREGAEVELTAELFAAVATVAETAETELKLA